MYCTKCGKEIDNDSKFCDNCGSKVERSEIPQDTDIENSNPNDTVYGASDSIPEDSAADDIPETVSDMSDGPDELSPNEYYNKKNADSERQTKAKGFKPAALVAGVVLAAGVAAGGVHYWNNASDKNTDASAQNETAKAVDNVTEKEDEQAADDTNIAANAEAVKNGESIAPETDKPEVIQKIDPFENVTVRYGGADGYGHANVERPTDGPIGSMEYRVDNNFGLKNGDVITVKLWDYHQGDIKENFLNNYGIELTQTEKEYTVSGLRVQTYEQYESGWYDPSWYTTSADHTDEYIIPDSNSRYLTEADLVGFDAEKCKKARNEIYARHGRKFKDEELQQYFNSCSWYTGNTEPDAFSETVFNEYEKANKDLISNYEIKMGYK